MSQVVLIGRLTKDPAVRYTTGQEPVAVARFSIAVERPIRTGSEKQADFEKRKAGWYQRSYSDGEIC